MCEMENDGEEEEAGRSEWQTEEKEEMLPAMSRVQGGIPASQPRARRVACWRRLVRELRQDRNPGFSSTDETEDRIKSVERDRGIPRGKRQMVEECSCVKGHNELLLKDMGREIHWESRV